MINGYQKLKFDAKPASKSNISFKKYIQSEKDTMSVENMILARKLLVDQLSIATQLVKREQIKRKIIDRLPN